MSITNWPFARKLLVAFGAVVAAFAIISAINFLCLLRIEKAKVAIEQVTTKSLIIDEATKAMLDLSGEVRGFLLTRDEDFATGVATNEKLVAGEIKELEATVKAPEQTANLREVKEGFEGYMREAGTPEIRLGRDAATRDQALALITSGANKVWMNKFKAAVKKFVDFENGRTATATAEQNGALDTAQTTIIGGSLAATVIAILMGWLLTRQMATPVIALTAAMKRLASGDLSVDVPGVQRGDEIGSMGQTVQVFKDNAIKLQASEAEAARQRQAAEQERAANEATRNEIQRQQEAMVASIAAGLERLSSGDLTNRLNQAFSAEYEKLRADFNATAESLQSTLTTISAATDGISTGSDQIAHASDDLSRRTEQQAANLEETAAALNIITGTVKSMATTAGEAAKIVASTRGAAESSGAVVQQAVDAMGKIKESSTQITNIIGVIDEIAFQTNLLALNAGVEAARAGDAGRGFAVVASEVRALAQRSAQAAKEIKALISASTVQVESGVILVDKTGVALKDIIGKVAEMDSLVRQISAASQEQATGIAEINTAVAQMDQVVQQNAAMVEESTAAAHTLKSETLDLTAMVGRFRIGDHAESRVVAPLRKAATPAAAPRPLAKKAASGGASRAVPEKDWDEF